MSCQLAQDISELTSMSINVYTLRHSRRKLYLYIIRCHLACIFVQLPWLSMTAMNWRRKVELATGDSDESMPGSSENELIFVARWSSWSDKWKTHFPQHYSPWRVILNEVRRQISRGEWWCWASRRRVDVLEWIHNTQRFFFVKIRSIKGFPSASTSLDMSRLRLRHAIRLVVLISIIAEAIK